MKNIVLLVTTLSLSALTMAQKKESFDLLTFTTLKGWKKEVKNNLITYTQTDNVDKTWCVIGVVKSTSSKGNIDMDLQSEWNDLVVKQYKPDSMQATATQEAEGWKVKAASGKFVFNNDTSAVLLTTFSGYNRCVSIVATTNSQRYIENITDFVGNVTLSKPGNTAATIDNAANQQPVQTTQAVRAGSFTYTTSNFDDGWKATEEPDWVRVTKGSITILLHYAKEGTVIAADPEPKVTNAWNILVAPRYSNLAGYKVVSPIEYQRPYLGAGELTENQTGRRVYVALFRKGNSNWMEIIAPDKNTFVQAFGTDVNAIGWDASSEIWNPLLKMLTYNKFAVAAADLTGKWASWSGSSVQYVNVYTGLDAGMGHAQSSNEIVFNANGTYNREYKGVSGSPGSANQYHGEKNSGKAIVSNWEVQLTNAFKGETHAFSASFEAVKGGRILHLYRGNIEDLHLYKVK